MDQTTDTPVDIATQPAATTTGGAIIGGYKQPEGAPDLPERFLTGGATAEERDAWVAENWLPMAEADLTDEQKAQAIKDEQEAQARYEAGKRGTGEDDGEGVAVVDDDDPAGVQ